MLSSVNVDPDNDDGWITTTETLGEECYCLQLVLVIGIIGRGYLKDRQREFPLFVKCGSYMEIQVVRTTNT